MIVVEVPPSSVGGLPLWGVPPCNVRRGMRSSVQSTHSILKFSSKSNSSSSMCLLAAPRQGKTNSENLTAPRSKEAVRPETRSYRMYPVMSRDKPV